MLAREILTSLLGKLLKISKNIVYSIKVDEKMVDKMFFSRYNHNAIIL